MIKPTHEEDGVLIGGLFQMEAHEKPITELENLVGEFCKKELGWNSASVVITYSLPKNHLGRVGSRIVGFEARREDSPTYPHETPWKDKKQTAK